jgi:HPt (histidine-containing phosphotransfer) domain-containing protein
VTVARLLDVEDFRGRVGDDAELMRELSSAFVQRLPASLAALEKALAAADAKALERAAHTFKSSIAIFGAAPAVEAALAMERLGHEGRVDGAAALLAELTGLIHELEAEIRAIVIGAAG